MRKRRKAEVRNWNPLYDARPNEQRVVIYKDARVGPIGNWQVALPAQQFRHLLRIFNRTARVAVLRIACVTIAPLFQQVGSFGTQTAKTKKIEMVQTRRAPQLSTVIAHLPAAVDSTAG